MNTIKTTIPLSEEDLDKYFDMIDKHEFVIDYAQSEYKGKQFLNYVYNSSMHCIIEFSDLNEDVAQLLVEYITYKKQLSIPTLDNMWNEIIATYLKNEPQDEEYKAFVRRFIDTNKDLFDELISVLFCLKMHLINIAICDSGTIEGCEDRTYTRLGENYISIRNSQCFWLNLLTLDSCNLPIYNYTNFEEMSFDGRKVSHYFLNEFSPFAMFLQLIKEGGQIA